MFRKLTLFGIFFAFLNFSVFSRNMETVSIILTDQNGDLIRVGIVTLLDYTGKKAAEINLSETSKTAILRVVVGGYNLNVQSPGFKFYTKSVEVKKGQNNFEVQLLLEDINVNVKVEQNEREKRLDEAFGGFLSEKDIASLPENGEDIKEELRRRYGDDVLIRIDGDFDGSQVPSRAEISSIKVIRNMFDAEFHEVGRIIIDIRTNTIVDSFRGFASFSLNNSSLNARSPFAIKRQPESTNNLIMYLSGPLIKKKTSFNFSTFTTTRVTTQNFIGTGVDANSVAPQKTRQRLAFSNFGIKHNLPKNHILNFKYQNSDIRFKNIGLGAFDLPERGAALSNVKHKFSILESGTFSDKYANDFTFEYTVGLEKTSPNSSDTTILVLNAFNSGGAGVNKRTDSQKLRMADNLVFDARKHSLKVGSEIEYERFQNISQSNLNGTFTFLNLADFNIKKPAQFSQTLGETEYKLSQLRTSFYFQDYFKLNKGVQLSLGMRYEWQNDLNDYNNFSPRFGYVWSPEKSGKFIVRGGIGVFYDWLDPQTLSAILSNDGRQAQRIIIRNPGFPNPFDGGTVLQLIPASISKLSEDLSTPYIFVTQNGFNYKFDKSLTFEGIYTFRRGLHHFRSRNINAPVNEVRPNLNFGVIQLLESSGMSNEHSFELRTNAYYRGVNIYGNYQLAKQTANFSDALSLPSDN